MKIERPRHPGTLATLLSVFVMVVAFPMQSRAEKSVEEINRLLLQGRQEDRQDKFDRAIITLSAALKLNPTGQVAAEIYGERGGAYADKGDLDKAMADAETAVRLAPQYFRGYQVRGRVYRLRKQFDRALQEFNRALKLAPRFAQLYNNRGNLFGDKREPRRAIQDYNEAIRLAPGVMDGYVNRGGAYVVIGEFDKAIADLDQAIRIDPRHASAYYNRAMAHKGKNDPRSALADYTKANELSPNDPATLNSIGWLKATCPLDALRNGKEAMTASLKACQLTRFRDANRLDTLAAAYAENGEFDQAIQYVMKALAIKMEPDDRREVLKHLALYREHKPCRDTEPRKPQSRS